MTGFIRWSALLVGLTMIVGFLAVLAWITVLMVPFGGVPYSWSNVLMNLRWVAVPVVGVALVAVAVWMFRRRGH